MFRFRLGPSFPRAHLTALVCVLATALPPAHANPPRTDLYGDPLPDGVRVRMGTIQLRHENATVAVSADGRTLISCGLDGIARHWSIARGRLLRQTKLTGTRKATEPFYDFALTANGTLVAIMGKKGRVHLYDTDSGREKGSFSIAPFTEAWLRFSLDGKRLLVEDEKERGSLQVWDVSPSKKNRTLSVGKEFDVGAFSPHGDILAMKGPNNKFRLWSVSTNKTLRELEGTASWIKGSTFSPDGKTFAASHQGDEKLHLWETASGKVRASLPVPEDLQWNLTDLAFSPDGARLAGIGMTRVGVPGLIVWDVAARKILRQFPESEGPGTAFTPDGRTLICKGSNEIRLWDVATGKRMHDRPGHASAVQTVAVSPDGKLVASVALGDPDLHLWDIATGRLLHRLPSGDDGIRSCTFSPDGKRILSCGERGTLRLWDTASGKETRRPEDPEAKKMADSFHSAAFAFSVDGKRLSMFRIIREEGERGKGQLMIWDTDSGKLLSHRPYQIDIREFLQPRGGSGMGMGGMGIGGAVVNWFEMGTALTPEGKGIAVFTPGGEGVTVRKGKRLIIEDAATGRTLVALPENVGAPAIFSPDGQLLAAGIPKPKREPNDDYKIAGFSLIESISGQEILRIKSGEGFFLDFSPDGRWLATADMEALHIWDVATGAESFRRPWPEDVVPHPIQYEAPVWPLAFLPNGQGVVTGMTNGNLLLWDLPSRMRSGDEAAHRSDGKAMESLWSDLAGNARKSHRAVCTLSAIPAQALPFLNDHLRPAEPIDAKLLAKQLADLDSDEFALRQQAVRTLTQWDEQVHPALRRYLREKPSLEARRRIEQILSAARPMPSAATLRTLRAIRVLERIGTAQTRQTLRRLAAGAEGASLTRAAQAALARLAHRSERVPPSDR